MAVQCVLFPSFYFLKILLLACVCVITACQLSTKSEANYRVLTIGNYRGKLFLIIIHLFRDYMVDQLCVNSRPIMRKMAEYGRPIMRG